MSKIECAGLIPACASCGEPIYADYDGEFWHEGEKPEPVVRTLEVEVPLLSFNEQVAEYRRTGIWREPAPFPDEEIKVYGNTGG